MSAHPTEWSYEVDGSQLRLMRLPDRRALYLVLINDEGMHCVARTLGDREAVALVGWLDAAMGTSEGAPQ